MDNQQVIEALGYLYRITDAGERGYAVAATNVRNRALKVLFRTNARQRNRFKKEILNELDRLDGSAGLDASLLGVLSMIHRGRINIFAALTIQAQNAEQVILKEIMIGERLALRAYEKVSSLDLPEPLRDMVARQYQELRDVVAQIRLMRGRKGKRLVVRLYDSKQDAEEAYRSLKKADVSESAIEMEELGPIEEVDLHRSQGITIFETVLSGAVGGLIWGSVAGGLAAFGVFTLADTANELMGAMSIPLFALLSALGLMVGGAFIGSMIGLFIGWGVASEDSYLYDDSLEHGRVLLRATTADPIASKAWKIMHLVEVQARTKDPIKASA